MAKYDRRDRLQHFIRKEQPPGQHCTHACCRGYREHPKGWAVVPMNRQLRRATDYELATHFSKVSAGRTAQHRYAENQILAEMQRRDDRARAVQERTAQRREAVAANRAAEQMARESDAERIRLEAEAETKGYLVNAQGRARGISDEEILTGREAVFHRYATDEAKEYFRMHNRPTGAYLRYGRDTRVHERYTERPKRRRAVSLRFR